MTAKEKAKHLVEIFGEELAPKVVDEILNALSTHQWQNIKEIKYFEEVKTEIDKLL